MRHIILSFLLFPLVFHGQNNYGYNNNLVIISDTKSYLESVSEDDSKSLVNVCDYVKSIKLDIRYASKNNFTGEVIYDTAMALARKPVVIALSKVQKSLNEKGYGLILFDAYRPYSATVKFYEVFRDTNYVASPWQGSRHNRGAAVDVSIIELQSGKEIEMPTPFDDFTEKAHYDFDNLPQKVIKNRDLLISEMQNHGFTVYPYEWWHFDFIGWEEYSLMDLSFKDLSRLETK